MNEKLDEVLLAAGAVAAGKVGISCLWSVMPSQKRLQALEDMPRVGGLLCGIFPYFYSDREGNISLYARGYDYHQVVVKRLEKALDDLKTAYPDEEFRGYVDVSPYPEKIAAAMAGVGMLGRNTLLIAPGWGSYVFIGTIATSLPLAGAANIRNCRDCGSCIRACPSGALGEEGLNIGLCRSAITQKKGNLTGWERDIVEGGGEIWGCDICQKVCPENRNARISPLEEFRNDLIFDLNAADLAISDKDFRKKYKNRAFAWRGGATLRRNLGILNQRDRIML